MTSVIVLLVWLLSSSPSLVFARALRATQATEGTSKAKANIPMCVMTGRDTYQTMSIAPRDAWRYLTFYKAVRGNCRAVCGSIVCSKFPSFAATRQQCNCTGVPIQCGKNAQVNPITKQCECVGGYEGDDSKGCMDRNECTEAIKPCALNQECNNAPLGSFTCAPRSCANPFGNPCGPGRACSDSPTGFLCSDIPGGVQCPGGCELNASCVANACTCNTGFVRPQPFLPCVATSTNSSVSAPSATPLCGINAERSIKDNSCVCKAGYKSVDPAKVGCSDHDECVDSVLSPCRSNQECRNTVGSYACLPLLCANPFGNPCGPGRSCADSPIGYTCSALFGPDVCPVACDANSTCRRPVSSSGPASCVCNTGFVRPIPSLGCVPQV